MKALLPPYLDEPRTAASVAEAFGVQKGQARGWLQRLVADGAIEKLSNPVRYRIIATTHPTPLFPAAGAGES